MFTLYRLTFSNGKIYIGQTVRSMRDRLSQHSACAKGGSLLPVHCAWRKHGPPAVEVIAQFENHEDLHAAERFEIAAGNAFCPHGYNVAPGGETAPSESPQVAAKIAARARERWKSDEYREKAIASIGRATVELWQDPEYRKKVSAGLKKSWTDETREAAKARIEARWEAKKAAGWAMPESTKVKLRGRGVSAETRAKMSAAAKARVRVPPSEETRKKLSENAKAKWQDAAHAEKRVAAIREAQLARYAGMTEDQRVEFSEIRKRAWETRRLKHQKDPS